MDVSPAYARSSAFDARLLRQPFCPKVIFYYLSKILRKGALTVKETKDFHLLTAEEALAATSTAADGLSTEEAEKRLAEHGKNKLAEGKKIPIWKRFLQQLADPMIIILLVAATISLVISLIGPPEDREFADVIIILAVVLINATLGVIQESKAEAAIEALKQMTAATTKVLRDGKQITVKSEDLVVGDVI
ncbi:MAG: hypothetical protein J6T24_08220, partial [Clostridia bacterium]|nr:hypothetical protein [Clostridia bacterium]